MKRIALVGNPNSGKSTLFNALTGSTQFVGNWPGVTVEKKEGKTKIGGESVAVVDLPGIYSLSPYSNEEIISRDFILNEKPDVVIDIVDASNLERNLYLTTQLVELGVPVIVALNMMDIVEAKGEVLDSKALSKALGCPVCEISAIKNVGLDAMKQIIAGSLKVPEHSFAYSADVKETITEMRSVMMAGVKDKAAVSDSDFYAAKVLAEDHTLIPETALESSVWAKAAELRAALEKKHDDDFESIIAEQRYTWIKSIIGSVIVKKRKEVISLSDKIDRVLTNKILALPIFFAIMYVIYYICLNPNGLGKKLVGITFGWVFTFLFWVMGIMTNAGVAAWLTDLVCNGVIFGVGIVIAFVPYLMVLFVFLAIMEECGYMARITFIMDRIFRRFGMSGKSFVPLLLGTGCTVQAVAASRTIENDADRKMTIFLTPFIPCATMMPGVMLICGVITDKAWVPPMTYLLAMVFIILGGIFLKNTFLKGEPAPFVMELPEYKMPRLKNIWHFVWDRTVAFFKKATSIIVVTTVIVWFLKSFTFGMQYIAAPESGLTIENSMLAAIGMALEPVFAPLGFGNWKLIASLLTSYVAKDNILGTLAVIMGVAEATPEGLLAAMSSLITPAGAVGFLLFFVLSSPCFATMGGMRKELGSGKLTLGAVAFQCCTAYLAGLIGYQVVNLFI